jgi:hypothetical protein
MISNKSRREKTDIRMLAGALRWIFAWLGIPLLFLLARRRLTGAASIVLHLEYVGITLITRVKVDLSAR